MPNFAPKGLAADLLQFMLQLEVQFDIYNLHWPNPSCKRGSFIITHSHGYIQQCFSDFPWMRILLPTINISSLGL